MIAIIILGLAFTLVAGSAYAAMTFGNNAITTDSTINLTGGNVGIGTTSPTYGLDVQSNATGFPVARFCITACEDSIAISAVTSPNNDFFEMHLHSWATGIAMYDHADAGYNAPYMQFYKSRGTQASPTAITYTGYELDSMGGINFGGYDGSSYAPGAAILTQNDENWTPSAHGGHLSIYFTRAGAITQNQMVQFGGKDSSGVAGNNAIFYWPLNLYSNSSTGVSLGGGGAGNLVMTRGDGSAGALLTVNGTIQVGITTAASLGTCNSAAEGKQRAVTDSNTVTWGATVAGGGANHILAYCDGTNWTVMGK